MEQIVKRRKVNDRLIYFSSRQPELKAQEIADKYGVTLTATQTVRYKRIVFEAKADQMRRVDDLIYLEPTVREYKENKYIGGTQDE